MQVVTKTKFKRPGWAHTFVTGTLYRLVDADTVFWHEAPERAHGYEAVHLRKGDLLLCVSTDNADIHFMFENNIFLLTGMRKSRPAFKEIVV